MTPVSPATSIMAETKTEMARRKRGRPVHGWLLLDKPVGMTSTRAVGIVRRLFDARKAGHAGTLDPLASGLLPIAFGEATKTVSFVMDGIKVYRFTVRWGIETDTDDSEGDVSRTSRARPSGAEIETVLERFTGRISQIPPKFSAIRVAGERAYDIARDGGEVELKPRMVEIDSLQLVELPDRDHAIFEVTCGKGTYVRALARDMGRLLGSFGHVCALRRERVGPFSGRGMIVLEKLEEIGHKDAGHQALLDCLEPLTTALDDIPALAVDRNGAARLRQGQAILLRGGDAPVNEAIVIAMLKDQPVALATVESGMAKPVRVFNFGNQLP